MTAFGKLKGRPPVRDHARERSEALSDNLAIRYRAAQKAETDWLDSLAKPAPMSNYLTVAVTCLLSCGAAAWLLMQVTG